MIDVFLKIVGWVMVIAPLVAFLTISYNMISGVAKDDMMVKHLLTLGTTLVLTGGILLLALYFTDFVPTLIGAMK